jgi:type IV pilus assembly protein PilM
VGRTLVGLDIGHTSVRAIGVTGGATPTVYAVGTAPLPPGAVNEGEVLDVDAVAAAVKQAWAGTKLGRDVVVGLSGRHVIVRRIDLPWLEEKAFRKALPYRVAGQLPVPVEDVVLDYVVLGEAPATEGATGRSVRILLVAAMRSAVERAVAAVEKAGLRPNRVDLTALALMRVSAFDAPGSAHALVDLGAEVTTLSVTVDGVARFVRMLPGEGGLKISRALVDRLGVTLPEAEALKARLGITQVDVPVADEDRAAQAVIDKVAGSTMRAIRDSLDYFRTNAPEVAGLARVSLSGGGAELPGLAAGLELMLQAPVTVLDPFEDMQVQAHVVDRLMGAGGTPDPALAVAAGLSLAEVA